MMMTMMNKQEVLDMYSEELDIVTTNLIDMNLDEYDDWLRSETTDFLNDLCREYGVNTNIGYDNTDGGYDYE